ncbi:hypothetical protein [Streptomyces sp. CB02115]|uniref:hypothetical protein n=1 Tax=Streptomyces sp. CB02115 TaxID=1703939 RepID=UPI0009393C18|nr:hypothetical protein [Streptomyces sp. CB02115]OKJ55963.1 hypothetical protein AMK28_13960 [Streptomyces sp. CB02115]
MKLPVDDTTLAAWSTLLGLTEKQTAATLEEISNTLRRGYEYRPDELRDATFDQLISDMDRDEAALMFLISGLRHAGYPKAAYEIEVAGIFATLRPLQHIS